MMDVSQQKSKFLTLLNTVFLNDFCFLALMKYRCSVFHSQYQREGMKRNKENQNQNIFRCYLHLDSPHQIPSVPHTKLSAAAPHFELQIETLQTKIIHEAQIFCLANASLLQRYSKKKQKKTCA